MTTENLTVPARRRAGLAIENTHKEYTKPNGLRALEQRIEEAQVKCSQHIFELAKFAFRTDGIEPEEHFTDLCSFAEDQFKKRHKVDNVKDVLPVWAVFKSNINRGIKQGLDPNGFKTEWEFRKATMEEIRETNGGNAGGGESEPQTRTPRQTQGSRPTPVNVPDVEEWVGSTTIHSSLQVLVARLVVEAEYIRKGRGKEAENILREAIGALSKLIDKRKIKDAATRAALAEAA